MSVARTPRPTGQTRSYRSRTTDDSPEAAMSKRARKRRDRKKKGANHGRKPNA